VVNGVSQQGKTTSQIKIITTGVNNNVYMGNSLSRIIGCLI
jgi:hypothetical protein